jgi:hypothetical protein
MSQLSAQAAYLNTRDTSPEAEADREDMERARARDRQRQELLRAGLAQAQEEDRMGASVEGGEKLGHDFMIGAYDAIREGAETALDVSTKASHAGQAEKAVTGKAPDVNLKDLYPEFIGALDTWREKAGRDDDVADVVVQKFVQFGVPFAGALNVFRVGKAATTAGKAALSTAAAFVTDFSVWSPHEGRLADLARALAPDNKLIARLTDYLASDPEDSDMENRLKNAIEGTVAGGVVGLLGAGFYYGAKALKAAGAEGRALAKQHAALAKGEAKVQQAIAGMETDKTLSAADAAIEAEFAAAVKADPEAMFEAYAKLPDSKGGRVLSVDTARELSPAYFKDRSKSAAVHEPASAVIKALYARAIARPPAPGQDPLVLITAGGTGVGKTSGLETTIPKIEERAQVVLDTNMNNYRSAKGKVDQALANDKTVIVALTERDLVESFEEGVLKRATGQEAKYGTGRTVPVKKHFETHVNAEVTVKRLMQDYGNDPRVAFMVIDNRHGKNKAKLIDPSEIALHDDSEYTGFEVKARGIAQQRLVEGRISERTYTGVFGEGDRGGIGGQPQPGLNGRLAGITRSGREVLEDPLAPVFDTPLGRAVVRRLVPRGQANAPRVFRRNDPDVTGRYVAFEPDPEVDGALRALGVDPPKAWLEVDPAEHAADFSAKLKETFESGPTGKQVTALTPEELAGHRLFVAEGGQAGFAISPQGELVGLWKDVDAYKLATVSAVQLAIEQGATHLNAFDQLLPKLYARLGFKEVARLKFNREYAPEKWDYWRLGTPDVVFMRYDPASVGKPHQPGQHYVESYDEGMALARGELKDAA